MIKYVVDMFVYGRGDATAVVEAHTAVEARELVENAAFRNDTEVDIRAVVPWEEFVTVDMGLDFIPRK